MINWDATTEEFDLIGKITDRTMQVAKDARINYDRQEAVMDLTAAHCNGSPLDLQALLGAQPFDFSHDVFGIARHINRDTGKLENCFVPRYRVRVRA